MIGAWALLFAWVAATALHFWLGAVATARAKGLGDARLGSLKTSRIAAVFPAFVLALYFAVFIAGGGSSLAQMSAPGLWVLWHKLFGMVFLGTSAAFLASVVAAALPPYLPRRWHSLLCRLAGVAAAGLAWFHVLMRVPDA